MFMGLSSLGHSRTWRRCQRARVLIMPRFGIMKGVRDLRGRSGGRVLRMISQVRIINLREVIRAPISAHAHSLNFNIQNYGVYCLALLKILFVLILLRSLPTFLSTPSVPCSQCPQSNPVITLCIACNHTLPRRAQFVPYYSNASEHAFVSPGAGRILILENISLAQSQLEHVKSLMKDLESTHSALEGYVYTQTFRFALVRTIPSEVMSLILSEVVKTNNVVYGVTPALLLSHVCRAWRDVATGLPSLWSCIFMSIRDETHMGSRLHQTATMVAKLQHCLIMSKRNLLDIRMVAFKEPVTSCLPLLNLVVAECSRWLRLSMSAVISGSLPSTMDLSNLTHLTIEDDLQARLINLEMFADAPLLHSVSLDTRCLEKKYFSLLPFQQITSFRGRCYIQDLLGVQLSLLEHLELLSIDSMQRSATENPLELPS